jgi:glucose/arabinose dehydrogenase
MAMTACPALPRKRSRRLTAAAAAALVVLALPAGAHARATNGSIGNVAGSTQGFAGDGGPAGVALMNHPSDVAYQGDGSLLIADRDNSRVRIVTTDGRINSPVGDGSDAPDCNDVTAISGNPQELAKPRGVTAGAPGGGFLISDTGINCIRRFAPNGDLLRFAGAANGTAGASGDGGQARSAQLNAPGDVAVAGDGSVYIADTGNNLIRRVASNGTISTVAGTVQGFGGDEGPATAAKLSVPRDIAIAADGSLLIADTGNDRVRKVTPDGNIHTVAGGAGPGGAGDGDPAVSAQLNHPTSVVALPNGGFLLADASNNRVRRVTPLGAIFNVAGTVPGLGGDNGLAKDAKLNDPEGITARPGGGFAVADTTNARVRAVSDVGAVPGAVIKRSMNLETQAGAVMVRPAGTSAFLPLNEEDLVPFGSVIDTRRGFATIAVQRGNGGLEPATAFDGSFVASQGGTAADPVTELAMTDPLICGKTANQAKPANHAAAAALASPLASAAAFGRPAPVAFVAKKRKKAKYLRRLWTDAHGKYRIRGRRVVALEKGTKWRVMDACDRSSVTVARGSVIVRDLVRNKTRVVRAGQTFTVFAK